ncbi:hypothetical protein [Halalkalicoccus ordinarius]|uniref:hypothetical protein n=1 Tax=Halalkalicoccus ordinarius TaxID=3116651 RepID=UPI00300E9EDB
MDRSVESVMNRRRFLRYGGALGTGGLLVGGPSLVAASEPVDDYGNPIDDSETEDGDVMSTATVKVASWSTTQPTGVEAESRPDGRVVSNRYAWRTPGASRTGNGSALELEDRGGVDVGFRPRTAGDLTIDFHWRHRSGRNLAYVFNDQNSASSGFRAFTNGIAGRGMWFRNTFGGSDVVYRGNLQDGRWHWIRVVLDAAANTYTAYVDGQRIGRSYYHGRGWTAADRFRVMGRYSGTRTRVEYDRYVVADEAVHLDETAIDGTLVHYELEEGEGRTLANARADRTGTHPLVARKTTLIESIRSDAGRILADPDVARIDRRAERLLEQIDDGFDRADAETRTQYERALERMVLAEEVTATATESGIEPTHRITRATVDLGLARAAGRILGRTLRSMGWAARRIASILSNVASMAGRTLHSITGWSLLPLARRRELDRALARMERRVSEMIETHGEDIGSVGETVLSDSLKSGIDHLPEDVLDALGRIREEFTAVIERIFYGSFQFDSQVTIGALDLGIPGVNVSVEDAMGAVSDGIDDGSLDGEWHEERRTSSEQVCEEIRQSEAVFVGGMRAAEGGADYVSLLGLWAAVTALGLFAIGICIGATGAGLAVGATMMLIATKLKIGAAALGKISLALTVSISLVGIAFLTWTAKQHNEAIIEPAAFDSIAREVSQ